MSRLGRAARIIFSFLILLGVVPQAAFAGPPRKISSIDPLTRVLLRDPKSDQHSDGGTELSTFQNFYTLEIDSLQIEEDPFYWRLPAIIDSVCRNSAEVSFSEYLYCVDSLVSFVTETEENPPR